jgi:pantetheine-phosphate adenylyltransferase
LTIAIYPGSFDPVTSGHIDIATRAAAIFDKLVVAVYDTPAKSLLFTTDERVEMVAKAVANLDNVSVTSFSGLVVRFASVAGAKVIVRGLRAISDFEIELQMAHLNRRLAPDIEVCCLMTSLPHSYLSASMIKEIAKLGGDVEGMVPPHVVEALQLRYSQTDLPSDPPRHLSM